MIAPEILEPLRKDIPLDGDGEELFLRLVEKKTNPPDNSLARLRKRIADEKHHSGMLIAPLDRHAEAIAKAAKGKNLPPDTFWDDQIKALDLALLALLIPAAKTGVDWAIKTVKGKGRGLDEDQESEVADDMEEWAKTRSSNVAASMIQTSKDRTAMLLRRAIEQDLDEDDTEDLLRDRVNVDSREKNVAAYEVGEAHEHSANAVWEKAGAIGVLWTTFDDSKVCEVCELLDNVIVDVGDTFISKDWEGERPPVHNRCRCMTSPVFPSEEE